MIRRLLLVGVCSLSAVAGCSWKGPPPPQTFPVSGKVLLANGQPLSTGWVVLHPKTPPGNEAMGAVQKDGTFVLGTFGKDDGALPGRYVVTVGPPPGIPGGANTAARAGIPKRYWEAGTSPLTVEVKAQEKNDDLSEIRLR
jgi:hypothetical protein